MATIASLRGSAHPMICDKCGETLIAPQYAEFFTEENLILNLWSCERCGNRFETEALMSAAAERGRETPDEARPSLLVA